MINIKRYRPAFIQEAEIAATKAAEEAETPRTCEGYPTAGFDEKGQRKIAETVCGNPLLRHLGRYCSGECLVNAKANGTYRND
jgi:hypothetical protein